MAFTVIMTLGNPISSNTCLLMLRLASPTGHKPPVVGIMIIHTGNSIIFIICIRLIRPLFTGIIMLC